jgi:hypothetical protein
MSDVDRNDLAFWFPLIEASGLPVPETRIVTTDVDLTDLLDGQAPVGFEAFLSDLGNAARNIGYPCFLRTGHGSGKHEWAETCFVASPNDLGSHVAALVEWSHLVDMMGLPHQTWAVRKLLATKPLFRCQAWYDFPVTREFRVFIRDDNYEADYPYWPADAVEQGRPDDPAWRELLAEASRMSDEDIGEIATLAGWASGAVGGGYWSIDFLQDTAGKWWLTDMADGDRSYRPETSP